MPPSGSGTSVCLSCRLRLLARLYSGSFSIRPPPPFIRPLVLSSQPATPIDRYIRVRHFGEGHVRGIHSGRAIRQQHEASEAVATDVPNDGLELVPVIESDDAPTLPRGTPEEEARAARQLFGDRLPEGILNEAEYKMYERLYGTPLPEEVMGEVEVEDGDVLLREGNDGLLEEVEYSEDSLPLLEQEADPDIAEDQDQEVDEIYRKRSKADTRLENDIQAAVGASSTTLTIRSPDELAIYEEEERDSDDLESEGTSQDARTHPFTLAGRFGTNPSALPLPQDGLTGPVSLLLADLPNKHLDESASKIFGGAALPYGTGTPASSRTMPQKPIPLSASQSRMTEMEADLYMTAVMPGTYAAVMSVLVETRKRLGSQWIEGLMKKDGGPRILDAGAGGAGVLAWREVLKAEWSRLNPQSDGENATTSTKDMPFGKATVLTASNALRQRASILLDNTTFIPRLPDYVHTHFEADAERKQFDIVIAPHGLWQFQEDYERRQRVLNLWSLLDPNGGVLILLEKGVPRGFEVVADARGYLLSELFEGSTLLDEDGTESTNEAVKKTETNPSDDKPSTPQSLRTYRRAPGRIIAPCTNHTKCPMYLVPGVSRQRKDYCHFSQRYVRPTYLQRMLGARDRNHEDVRFSYIAVQKGIAYNDPAGVERGVFLGERATDRAFMGYEVGDEDVTPSPSPSSTPPTTTTTAPLPPQTPSHFHHPTPRLILQPLKRHGHILLDVCTPSGRLERWTVTRSPSRQAYRDARKAKWGDLWKLGAKFRTERRVRLGWSHMERGIGTGRGEVALRGLSEMDGEEEGEERVGRGGGGVKLKGKGNGIGKRTIKDVMGRSRKCDDGDDEGDVRGTRKNNSNSTTGGGTRIHQKPKKTITPQGEARLQKRKEEKERGRAKARRRKREERRVVFGSGASGGGIW